MRAIFAVIAQPLTDRLATGHGIADHLQRDLVPITGLQKPAILVQNLVTAVPRECFKGFVRVNQDGVVPFKLGYHNAVLGRVNHALQQTCVDHQAALLKVSEWFPDKCACRPHAF